MMTKEAKRTIALTKMKMRRDSKEVIKPMTSTRLVDNMAVTLRELCCTIERTLKTQRSQVISEAIVILKNCFVISLPHFYRFIVNHFLTRDNKKNWSKKCCVLEVEKDLILHLILNLTSLWIENHESKIWLDSSRLNVSCESLWYTNLRLVHKMQKEARFIERPLYNYSYPSKAQQSFIIRLLLPRSIVKSKNPPSSSSPLVRSCTHV